MGSALIPRRRGSYRRASIWISRARRLLRINRICFALSVASFPLTLRTRGAMILISKPSYVPLLSKLSFDVLRNGIFFLCIGTAILFRVRNVLLEELLKFRFCCSANKLVTWLSLIFQCRHLINMHYTSTSYVVKTGMCFVLRMESSWGDWSGELWSIL